MANEDLTTIQIDVETRDKLKVLAKAFERTAAGQLRWLVNQELEKLELIKVLNKGAMKDDASNVGGKASPSAQHETKKGEKA